VSENLQPSSVAGEVLDSNTEKPDIPFLAAEFRDTLRPLESITGTDVIDKLTERMNFAIWTHEEVAKESLQIHVNRFADFELPESLIGAGYSIAAPENIRDSFSLGANERVTRDNIQDILTSQIITIPQAVLEGEAELTEKQWEYYLLQAQATGQWVQNDDWDNAAIMANAYEKVHSSQRWTLDRFPVMDENGAMDELLLAMNNLIEHIEKNSDGMMNPYVTRLVVEHLASFIYAVHDTETPLTDNIGKYRTIIDNYTTLIVAPEAKPDALENAYELMVVDSEGVERRYNFIGQHNDVLNQVYGLTDSKYDVVSELPEKVLFALLYSDVKKADSLALAALKEDTRDSEQIKAFTEFDESTLLLVKIVTSLIQGEEIYTEQEMISAMEKSNELLTAYHAKFGQGDDNFQDDFKGMYAKSMEHYENALKLADIVQARNLTASN
jgi:hypothetical protein